MVLKRPHRQSHDAPLPDPQSSLAADEVREHSLDGMPVCRHCHKDFVTVQPEAPFSERALHRAMDKPGN